VINEYTNIIIVSIFTALIAIIYV